MKVAVFGAAGALGRRVLSRLIEADLVTGLVAADHDTALLAGLHSRLGHLGVAVRFMEAADPRSFRERMSGCDAVISCLGGEGADELPPAAEAVERGALYLSPTEEPSVFLRDREASRGEGDGLAVMGLGWSPGLSNLLAAWAGRRFQRLDEIGVAWRLDARELNSPGGRERLLNAFGGKCLSFEEGRLREVQAGSWEEWVPFPPDSSPGSVAYARGPEPLTLPRLFPQALRVRLKGGLAQPHLHLPVHTASWASSLLPEPFRELLVHAVGMTLSKAGGAPGEAVSALRVELKGLRGGERHHLAVGATGGYLDATAAMLVGALFLLLRSPKRPRGILAPEEALELRGILPALRREGVRFWMESGRI